MEGKLQLGTGLVGYRDQVRMRWRSSAKTGLSHNSVPCPVVLESFIERSIVVW